MVKASYDQRATIEPSTGEARRRFLPRGVVMLLGVVLTAGVMAGIAGSETLGVFQTCVYGLFVLPVVAAAWMLGMALTSPFARRAGVEGGAGGMFDESPWPDGFRSVVAIALGLGAFALGTLLLGSLGLLQVAGSPWSAALLPLIGAVIGFVPSRTFLRGMDRSFFTDKAHRGDWLMLLATVPVAILLVAATFAPGTIWAIEARGYDVMEYHLELPREYAANNSTAPLAHNVYSFFPQIVEMLYLLLMQFAKGVMSGGGPPWAAGATGYAWGTYPAQFLHVSMLLLAAASIALMPLGTKEKPWLGSTGRAVAVLLFLGVPWTIVTGSLAYNEAGMLLFGTLALGVALSDGTALAKGLLIGALLGLAVGCKMTAGVFFAVPVAAVLLIRGGRTGYVRRILTLIVAVVVASAAYAPWAVRAAAFSGGNPVFPVAASSLPHDGWTADQAARFARGHFAPEGEQAFSARAASLARNALLDAQWSPNWLCQYAWTGNPPPDESILKQIGLFWFVFPLALALAFIDKGGRGISAMLLLMLVLQVAAWMCLTHLQSRFLLPIAVPLALLMGRGAQGVGGGGEIGKGLASLTVGTLRVLVCTVVVAHALCTMFLLLPEARLFGGTLPPPTGKPSPQPIGAVFERLINVAAMAEHVEGQHAGGAVAPAKVLLIGEARAWLFAGARGDVVYFTTFDTNPFGDALRRGGVQEAAAWLHREHIRYVFINWSEVDRLRRTYGFDEAITPGAVTGLARFGAEPVATDLGPNVVLLRVASAGDGSK